MLKKLKLTNFKPFGTEDRPNARRSARLAPITIVYGPNSAGKSSLYQSIRLIAQTLNWLKSEDGSSHDWDLLTASDTEHGVDLGNFKSLVHKHDDMRRVSIELTMTDEFGTHEVVKPFRREFVGRQKNLEHRVVLTYEKKLDPQNKHSVPILIEVLLTTSNNTSPDNESSENTSMSIRLHRNNQSEQAFSIEEISDSYPIALDITPEEEMELMREWMRADRDNVAPNIDLNIDPQIVLDQRKNELTKKIKALKRERANLREQLEYVGDPELQTPSSSRSAKFIDASDVGRSKRQNKIRTLNLEIRELEVERDILITTELNNPLTRSKLLQNVVFLSSGDPRLRGSPRSMLPTSLLFHQGNESNTNSARDYLTLEDMIRKRMSDPRVRPSMYVVGARRVEKYLQYLEELFSLHLSQLRYIPPLRPTPKRIYKKGELKLTDDVIQEINSHLRRLEIDYTARLKTNSDFTFGDYVALELEDKNGTSFALTDVGFGLSQIFPILREGVLGKSEASSPKNSGKRRKVSTPIIIVEQPELHLHPRLQANLADFFIETSESVAAPTQSQDIRRGVQWLIETHSETLLLRIKRRIREGAISSRDVSVLYVYPDLKSKSTRVLEIQLSENGDFITEWPDGFFDEGYREIISQSDSMSDSAG